MLRCVLGRPLAQLGCNALQNPTWETCRRMRKRSYNASSSSLSGSSLEAPTFDRRSVDTWTSVSEAVSVTCQFMPHSYTATCCCKDLLWPSAV